MVFSVTRNRSVLNICFTMEINQMRHFCAVVETGHLRKAAAFLKMSPGALSNSLSKLQSDLQIQLTILDGRSLQITSDGKTVYSRFKNILKEIDSVSVGLSKASTSIKVITVGTFEVFSTYLLAECSNELSKDNSIRCLGMVPGKIETALANSEIDIGITYIPVPNSEVVMDQVCYFSFAIFGNHKSRNMSFEELEFAVPTTSVPQNPALLFDLDTWPISKVPRKIRFQFEMLQTALLTSARGSSVLYCPRFVVRHYNSYASHERKLYEIKVAAIGAQKHSVYLVRRKDAPEDQFHKRIAKHLRLLCKDE